MASFSGDPLNKDPDWSGSSDGKTDKKNTWLFKAPMTPWASQDVPNANLLFYLNKLTCLPDDMYIDEIHHYWWYAYDILEHKHGYIQWLFPISESGGMNSQSQALQPHEAKAICSDKKASKRFFYSYNMMLNFYGIQMFNSITGEVTRAQHWKERFKNMVTLPHNYMRITRILKSLGELGCERYKFPLVKFLLEEAILTGELSKARESCENYWIQTVSDNTERATLIQYASDFAAQARAREKTDLNSRASPQDPEATKEGHEDKGSSNRQQNVPKEDHFQTRDGATAQNQHRPLTQRSFLGSPNTTDDPRSFVRLERLSEDFGCLALKLSRMAGERANQTTVKAEQTTELNRLAEKANDLLAQLMELAREEAPRSAGQHHSLSIQESSSSLTEDGPTAGQGSSLTPSEERSTARESNQSSTLETSSTANQSSLTSAEETNVSAIQSSLTPPEQTGTTATESSLTPTEEIGATTQESSLTPPEESGVITQESSLTPPEESGVITQESSLTPPEERKTTAEDNPLASLEKGNLTAKEGSQTSLGEGHPIAIESSTAVSGVSYTTTQESSPTTSEGRVATTQESSLTSEEESDGVVQTKEHTTAMANTPEQSNTTREEPSSHPQKKEPEKEESGLHPTALSNLLDPGNPRISEAEDTKCLSEAEDTKCLSEAEDTKCLSEAEDTKCLSEEEDSKCSSDGEENDMNNRTKNNEIVQAIAQHGTKTGSLDQQSRRDSQPKRPGSWSESMPTQKTAKRENWAQNQWSELMPTQKTAKRENGAQNQLLEYPATATARKPTEAAAEANGDVLAERKEMIVRVPLHLFEEAQIQALLLYQLGVVHPTHGTSGRSRSGPGSLLPKTRAPLQRSESDPLARSDDQDQPPEPSAQ